MIGIREQKARVVAANQPLRREFELKEQGYKAWMQMPGETVFPFVHGTECERQQSQMRTTFQRQSRT